MSLSQLPTTDPFYQEIRRLIEEAQTTVATTVNFAMSKLYWQIGNRIHLEILAGKRADYGSQILATLSEQLVIAYGQGFSVKNLRHMINFAQAFPSEQIVSTLSRQLSWSHFKEIIYLDKPLQREYYAELCRIERWSVHVLRQKIDSMLYERTALSRKPEELARWSSFHLAWARI